MSIDPVQFRLYLVRAPLKLVQLWDASAEELLMLTAATESHLGRWIKQQGGPACGDFQMEPATFTDVNRYLSQHPIPGFEPCTDPNEMIYDRAAAAIYCRVRYLYDPEPLPAPNDIKGLAEYWKRVYNAGGKGDVQKAIKDYETYVVKG